MIIYLNGQFMDDGSDKAMLRSNDLGLTRGYGVFEFFRFENDSPRFLGHHLERLQTSAKHLYLEVPDTQELETAVRGLIDRNKSEIPTGGVSLVVTGGYSTDGYTLSSSSKPNIIAKLVSLKPASPEWYTKGVKVLLHNYERQTPQAKTIDYMEGIRMQPVLREGGFDFVVYVDKEENVRESDRMSLFCVVQEKCSTGDTQAVLVTPPSAVVLGGVTRRNVFQLAGDIGLPRKEAPVPRKNLLSSVVSEVFLTSTTKGIVPVTFIQGRTDPLTIGPITQQLMKAWPEFVEKHAYD